MSEDSPDWEAAARQCISSEMIDASGGIDDACLKIADRLDDGETVQTDDVEQLLKRIDELEYYVDCVIKPIAVGEWTEQYNEKADQ